MELLTATPNRFKGIEVDTESLPTLPNGFQKALAHSLNQWKRKGYKLVWLNIPIQKAALIPIATQAGFGFHHTGDSYLMLILRLVEDALIPAYATHYIGAGGVVLDTDHNLLVVSERHRRSKVPSYKLPGGALHQGEHIVECVQREVLEETGIQTRFDAIVCFRHWHGYRYSKSDIYLICRLSPLSKQVSIQESEIEEARWMPVQDYLRHNNVSLFNKHIVKAALENPGVSPMKIEGYSNPETHEIFMPKGMEHL